jgi:glycosyltransferase involved in cell wall biosynthesis
LKRLRLLFLIPNMVYGGAETQMLLLMRGLAKKNTVYLGLLYNHSERFDQNKNKVHIIHFNKKGTLDYSIFFKIADFIRAKQIDIVQTFYGNHHSYISCMIAGRGIPIGGIRSSAGLRVPFLTKILEITLPRYLTKRGRFTFVSNSHSGKHEYLRCGFLPESIKVIENGVDCSKYQAGDRTKTRKDLGIESDFVIGTTGRLIKDKNVSELIEIIAELRTRNARLTALIVGDGPERSGLECIAHQRGLQDRIIFTGNRDDMPDLLASMDLFVFPSHHPEGWPNAVGEAMAAGLPVITYDEGDVSKIIDSGVDGIIAKDKTDMIRNIRMLIDDDVISRNMSRNAMKKMNRFKPEGMTKRYEQLYFELLHHENPHHQL